MNKFDTIKRELVEDYLNKGVEVTIDLQKTTQRLKAIRSFSKLSEAEFTVLEEAQRVLQKALENIEDDLEEE